jgi:hypothetical protein
MYLDDSEEYHQQGARRNVAEASKNRFKTLAPPLLGVYKVNIKSKYHSSATWLDHEPNAPTVHALCRQESFKKSI